MEISEIEVLSETIVERLMDFPGFSEWFSSIPDSMVQEVYDEIDLAINSCILESDDCYEMDEE